MPGTCSVTPSEMSVCGTLLPAPRHYLTPRSVRSCGTFACDHCGQAALDTCSTNMSSPLLDIANTSASDDSDEDTIPALPSPRKSGRWRFTPSGTHAMPDTTGSKGRRRDKDDPSSDTGIPYPTYTLNVQGLVSDLQPFRGSSDSGPAVGTGTQQLLTVRLPGKQATGCDTSPVMFLDPMAMSARCPHSAGSGSPGLRPFPATSESETYPPTPLDASSTLLPWTEDTTGAAPSRQEGQRFASMSRSLPNIASTSHRLTGLVVTASASTAEDPGFESRLRRDFSGVESYQ